ncbi:hypothetical protein THRCLA_11483 [Thraustotheca clavata]|uniref:Uncharacterized protein n=1 Tax=Thraustotheca clavata TaxID=74557 RepID=A0A1V9Y7R3_9STRA|nr:hypothetical protein THRCLA_11483 [Thraustotheca clavata]
MEDEQLKAKRLVKRDKQRDFRRKVANQLDFLQNRVHELENQLVLLQRDKAMELSWADIAKAMRKDLKTTHGTQKKLQESVQAKHTFVEAMCKWVQSLYPSPERSPSQYPLWFNVGLCGNDLTRKAALEWITLHMYHHTPTVLQLAGFHPEHRFPSQDFNFDTSKGYCEYTYQERRFISASLSQVYAAYKHLYYTNSVEFVVAGRKVLDLKLIDQGIFYSRRKSKKDGIVHREFVSDDRIVHVQHSIHDDSKHPLGVIHRHRTTWIVLEAIAPNLVMETRFFHKSQAWTRDKGYVTLDEEAELVGMTKGKSERSSFKQLPNHVQEDKLRRHMAATYPYCMRILNNELDQVGMSHVVPFWIRLKYAFYCIKLICVRGRGGMVSVLWHDEEAFKEHYEDELQVNDHSEVKRRLKRDKQRDFRQKLVRQQTFLRGRVAQLEAQLRKIKCDRLMSLPWCEIARAMRKDMIATKSTRKKLYEQVDDQNEFINAIYKWVASLHQCPEGPISRYPLWFKVGLCGSDVTRRAAIDWITEHMYYHTPTILQIAGFDPKDLCPSQEFTFDTTKGHIEYIYQDRRFHCTSLSKLFAAFKHLFYVNTCEFVVAGRTMLDEQLLGDNIIYSRREYNNENVVHREFISENRIVHVQHSIHDDTRHPLGEIHRHRTAWIVLDALGPNLVMETKIFHKTQSWTAESGYVSIDEEAQIVGCFDQKYATEDPEDYIMLPSSVQLEKLRLHMAKVFPGCFQKLNRELEQAMFQLTLNDTTPLDAAFHEATLTGDNLLSEQNIKRQNHHQMTQEMRVNINLAEEAAEELSKSPNTTCDDTSPKGVEEKLEANDAKRKLKRDQQRDFRRKVHQQLKFLRTRVAELEEELEAKLKKRSTALPWSQVEKALRQDLIECQVENKQLTINVRQQEVLNNAMMKWFRSIYPTLQDTPAQYPPWYRVGLCGDEDSRRAICDWVTMHMYHHTDNVLQQFGFRPDDHTTSQDFMVNNAKGYIEYSYKDRCIHYTSLDTALEAFRRLYHTNSVDFVVAGRQIFDRAILSKDFVYSRKNDYNESLIHREFVTENRVVFVQHSIHDDALHPLTPIHRHKANWIVLDVIGPNIVMETKIFQKSQSWTQELGYFSIEQEAATIVTCEYHNKQLQNKERPTDIILKEHITEVYGELMTTINDELQNSMLLLDLCA